MSGDAQRQFNQTEAAAWLTERGLPTTQATVSRWCKSGKLPSRRVVGRVLISQAALEQLFAGEPVGDQKRSAE